jgi:hypothetical protein
MIRQSTRQAEMSARSLLCLPRQAASEIPNRESDLTHAHPSLNRARDEARLAYGEASPFLVYFARFGFAARGLVYLTVGFLAALTPIGLRKHPTGTSGALAAVLRAPAGWVLLWIIALGLLGWTCWQFIRAISDPEHAGRTPGGIAKRIAYAFSGVIELGLAVGVAGIALGWRHAARGGDERGVHDWTAWAMTYPFGRIVIGGIGAGILAYGLSQIAAGIFGRVDSHLASQRLGARTCRIILAIARFGIGARGAVFLLVGIFLMRSAWNANARQAHGLSGTLRTLAAEPYGKWLLGFCALGLIAYGMYELVLARFRRIRVQ